jgi:hypothetical protein
LGLSKNREENHFRFSVFFGHFIMILVAFFYSIKAAKAVRGGSIAALNDLPDRRSRWSRRLVWHLRLQAHLLQLLSGSPLSKVSGGSAGGVAGSQSPGNFDTVCCVILNPLGRLSSRNAGLSHY